MHYSFPSMLLLSYMNNNHQIWIWRQRSGQCRNSVAKSHQSTLNGVVGQRDKRRKFNRVWLSKHFEYMSKGWCVPTVRASANIGSQWKLRWWWHNGIFLSIYLSYYFSLDTDHSSAWTDFSHCTAEPKFLSPCPTPYYKKVMDTQAGECIAKSVHIGFTHSQENTHLWVSCRQSGCRSNVARARHETNTIVRE